MSQATTQAQLVELIDEKITTNGTHAIVGGILNAVLQEMTKLIGVGYNFMGVAPSTAPGTPAVMAAYLATPGTYENYDNEITIPAGSFGLFTFDGTDWTKTVFDMASWVNAASQLYYNTQAGSTAGKTITAPGFSLVPGGCIKIHFNNKNTANNPTLNVNGTGAHQMTLNGNLVSSTYGWKTGETVWGYYDSYGVGLWHLFTLHGEAMKVTFTQGSGGGYSSDVVSADAAAYFLAGHDVIAFINETTSLRCFSVFGGDGAPYTCLFRNQTPDGGYDLYALVNGTVTRSKIGGVQVTEDAEAGTTKITVNNEEHEVATNPVSVSQNTLTGKTELKVGSTTVPFDKVPEYGSTDLVESGGVAASKVQYSSDDELFDRNTAILGIRLNNTTGAESEDSSYFSSPFIAVEGNETLYVYSNGNRLWCYDSNKDFLRVMRPTPPYAVESDVKFVRISAVIADLGNCRIGLTATENPISNYLKPLQNRVTNVEKTITKKIDKKPLIELLDLSTIIEGYSIHNTYGTLKAETGVFTSDFIEVDANSAYYTNSYQERLYCYDSSKNYLGYFANGSGKIIENQTPSGASGNLANTKYVRIYAGIAVEKITFFSSNPTISIYNPTEGYNIVDLHKSQNVDFSTETVHIGAMVNLQNGGIEWRYIGGNARTHYAIPIDRYDIIKIIANSSYDAYYAFVYKYIEPTYNKEPIYVCLETKQYQSVTAGDSVTLDKPFGATHIIFNINNNEGEGIDHTPSVLSLECLQKQNTTKLNVASYNLGDFSGANIVTPSDEGKSAYRELLGKLGADILMTQEDVLYYGGAEGMTQGDDVKESLFNMFKFYGRQGTGENNYKGFGSAYHITEVKLQHYAVPSGVTFDHTFFLTGVLNKDDEQILIVSIHWDWASRSRRLYQIAQVLEYCEKYPKVIIAGDTNPFNTEDEISMTDDEIREADWKILTDAGYTNANGGYFGLFDTIRSSQTGEWGPCDNIFVRGGTIQNVWLEIADYMNDHRPICATVVF